MTPAPASPEPPRLARWLLRHLLDGAARSAILGDLDEEFVRFILRRSAGGAPPGAGIGGRRSAGIAACLRGPSDRNPVHDEGPPPSLVTLMHDRGGLRSDVRDGLRSCIRRPVLSLVVILTLAVGIGTNTALFSIVNALFLKKTTDRRMPMAWSSSRPGKAPCFSACRVP